MVEMQTISRGDTGAAVEDIQNRLCLIGLLDEKQIDGVFGDDTAYAVEEFCRKSPRLMEVTSDVDSNVWAALVDASYNLGDRTLYLKMPYFHGHDVVELQTALGALGFFCGSTDGIFGASTEDALRKFQMNLGLPSDGIAGAFTYSALRHLEHSWAGKGSIERKGRLGFARAADVLEKNAVCLFGTDDFTRSIASRMSNLSFATNPSSKIVSADMLSVEPDEDMLILQISTDAGDNSVPTVVFTEDDTLAEKMRGALQMAKTNMPLRMRIVFPEKSWSGAGEERTAQHYAITLLDALCLAL